MKGLTALEEQFLMSASGQVPMTANTAGRSEILRVDAARAFTYVEKSQVIGEASQT